MSFAYMFWTPKRRRRLQKHDSFRFVPFVLFEPFECMYEDWKCRRCILCEIRRTHKRHLYTVLFSDFGDFLIISGKDDAIEDTRLFRALYSVRYQRFTAQKLHIFSRNTLRPAACCYDSEHFHTMHPT